MRRTSQNHETHDVRFGLTHKIEETDGACEDFPWTDDPSSNECTKDLSSPDVKILTFAIRQYISCGRRASRTYPRHKCGEVIGSGDGVGRNIRAKSSQRKSERCEECSGAVVPVVD